MDKTIKTYVAEFFGTAVLVLLGCGSVTIGGFGEASAANITAIALTFGLAVTAMVYALGSISGAHINPAVTIASWAAGKLPGSQVPGYIIAQCVGAIAGAAVLLLILSSRTGGYDAAVAGLGQNGWGEGMFGGYSQQGAVIAEFIATFIFVYVILSVANSGAAVAGLVIGLTLVALHFAFINVTGLSVNPARSLGPALFVGGTALNQVWLFLVVPAIAGGVAGFVYKTANT
ncbi:MAG: aquaporin [Pseudomonadota bacterium]